MYNTVSENIQQIWAIIIITENQHGLLWNTANSNKIIYKNSSHKHSIQTLGHFH